MLLELHTIIDMKTHLWRLLLLILFAPATVLGQKTDSLVKKLDSLEKKADSTGHQSNNVQPSAYNDITSINVPVYFTLLWSDYKQQFTAPFHQTSKDWLKVAGFAGAIAALTTVDEPIQQFALDLKNQHKPVRSFSKYVSNTGGVFEAYTLAAFATWGWVFKKEKMKTTTLLATQAYLTSAAVSTVGKFLAGRQRPAVFNPDQVETEPTFHGPFAKLGRDKDGHKLNSSFPSGHTTLAFAAATVYAMEYKDKPWVPILSYSAASLMGLSRIAQNMHWTTDVLAGAMLGYLSGRQVVNNYHRYAKIQNTKLKNKVSFNFGYFQGNMLAGLSYRP